MLKIIVSTTLCLVLPSIMAATPTPQPGDNDTQRDMVVPSKRINPSTLGSFFDDGDASLLLKALKRQKDAFKRRSLKDQLILGSDKYSMTVLESTITHFELIWKEKQTCFSQAIQTKADCQAEFDNRMRTDFNWYRPVVKGRSDAHFTGYYSPTFYAKDSTRGNFRYGLYKQPTDPNDRQFSRNDILFRGALEGKGLELFYMDDPYELFLLHVEGGGVVEVNQNGQMKSYFLSYAGTNGQKFSFIGGYMRDQGYITDTSVASQRAFLKANPDKWEEIYAQTPSYVFMKITQSEPHGMESIPLTPGRSMAQDRSIYWRKGIMGFVKAKIPDYSRRNQPGSKKAMSRFFLDQDTGGAIRGEARADLYWGYGSKAQFLAEHMDDYGDLVFFVKN